MTIMRIPLLLLMTLSSCNVVGWRKTSSDSQSSKYPGVPTTVGAPNAQRNPSFRDCTTALQQFYPSRNSGSEAVQGLLDTSIGVYSNLESCFAELIFDNGEANYLPLINFVKKRAAAGLSPTAVSINGLSPQAVPLKLTTPIVIDVPSLNPDGTIAFAKPLSMEECKEFSRRFSKETIPGFVDVSVEETAIGAGFGNRCNAVITIENAASLISVLEARSLEAQGTYIDKEVVSAPGIIPQRYLPIRYRLKSDANGVVIAKYARNYLKGSRAVALWKKLPGGDLPGAGDIVSKRQYKLTCSKVMKQSEGLAIAPEYHCDGIALDQDLQYESFNFLAVEASVKKQDNQETHTKTNVVTCNRMKESGVVLDVDGSELPSKVECENTFEGVFNDSSQGPVSLPASSGVLVSAPGLAIKIK